LPVFPNGSARPVSCCKSDQGFPCQDQASRELWIGSDPRDPNPNQPPTHLCVHRKTHPTPKPTKPKTTSPKPRKSPTPPKNPIPPHKTHHNSPPPTTTPTKKNQQQKPPPPPNHFSPQRRTSSSPFAFFLFFFSTLGMISPFPLMSSILQLLFLSH